ncbi:hypothetical protein [Sporosarcina cascadiensis]|uniref:hypothetical protein n=1 Tax=Sporosarcina cascadiensis TaxID=2660747 RepID=UPI00129B3BC1|nr:hypothetical protein [Sporosarcina cascadiensis]
MWTFIFYGLFLVGFLLMILAIVKNVARTYWLAGLVMYVVSFLGSWSIGLYLLIVPFIFWSLALAHSFSWVKRPWQNVIFAVIGMILWYISITTIDDYWLFLPFAWLV